jgi:hypothetical protein
MKTNSSLPVILALVTAVLVFISIIVLWPKTPAETQVLETTSFTDREGVRWCLTQFLPSDGGIIAQPEAGSYEYIVIGTIEGVEVYQECTKLE